MEAFTRLIARCKGSASIEVNEHRRDMVSVEANEHRSYYQTIRDWFAERVPEASDEVIARCVEADCVVLIQAYPHTPIGFLLAVDCDADRAVEAMHQQLDAAGVERC